MATFVQPPCDEAVIRSKSATHPCAKSVARWVLAATIVGSSMAFIDGTAVNVALPAVQASLKATVVDVQWVIEAYALLLTALLLAGGSLGDRYGRRRIFLIGVTIFSIASAWCGLAGNIRELIAARALQGAGGALLVPASLAIISASFRDQDRGRAIGTWSGFTAITTAIGPVMGGWLVEKISWRAVFFINLPLAAAVMLISWLRVPESRDPDNERRLDWTGAAVVTIGLAALVYSLIESSRLGVRNLVVSAAFGSAVLLLVGFFFVESHTVNPMLPLSLFRSRDFSGANLVTLFLYAALGGTLFFLPLNLIQIQHYSATAAGAALLPFILLMFLLSRWSGGLVASYGAKLPLVVGPLVTSLGYALFVVPGIGASYWTSIFPAVCVLGLGMAISVAPLTTTIMNSVPAKNVGIASGINNAVSRAASLLAVAVFGIVMLHVFNSSLDRNLSRIPVSPEIGESLDQQRINLAAMTLPGGISQTVANQLRRAIDESFIDGYRRVMLAGGVLACISGIMSWLLVTGRRSAS